MLTTPPAVAGAFAKLIAALDAEISELQMAGRNVLHEGSPGQMQRMLRLAMEHAALRDQVMKLHLSWKSGQLPPLTPPPPTPPEFAKARVNPVLIRHIEGVGVQEAAKCLGVGTAQVKQWLESGALKGYRPTGGRWKITRKDLLKFSRSQRKL